VLDLRFVVGSAPRRVDPNSLLVLDARTLETLRNVPGTGPNPPAVIRGAGLVWTVDGERNRVLATDPESGRAVRTEVVGTDPIAVTIGFGAAWVANAGNASITRVEIAGSKIETIGLNDEPSAIASGAGYVWVLSTRSRKVIRIDPATIQVTKTVWLTKPPLALVAKAGRVYVTIGH
jgi:DNA-binding beta-propeller fold protein YncE